MPRVSKEQNALNHATIEKVSSRLFREKGLSGVSVADLMSAAGLTHGGFYGHFSSKDELAAVACTHAFGEALQRWAKRIAANEGDRSARNAIFEAYLSPRNLHDIGSGTGCPVVTLAGDVAREPADKPVHAAFTAGAAELVEVLASLDSASDPAVRHKNALLQWSMMVGAVTLARATQPAKLAAEVLDTARTFLLAQP